jgi:hypothetical protein
VTAVMDLALCTVLASGLNLDLVFLLWLMMPR